MDQARYEDIPVGYWSTTKFSGALPAKRVHELTDRVEKLQAAVKYAREEANSADTNRPERRRRRLQLPLLVSASSSRQLP